MRYMLLVYSPELAWTQDEWRQCVRESSQLCLELDSKSQFMAAAPLLPAATANTVRVREGQRLTTAGPFAETVEQLGGYYVIEVANLDEAIAIAARLPPAKKGTVEIRPLQEQPEMPAEREYDLARDWKQYLLLCYRPEAQGSNESQTNQEAALPEAVRLAYQLDAAGQYLSASPLQGTATATSVRMRDGKRLICDGPFAESSEVLGGYYLIRARSVAAALDMAARHPYARTGAVEVREVHDVPGLRQTDASQMISARDLADAPATVFAAFSDPDRLARWWGPTGFRNTFHKFEFEPGGRWEFTMHGPNGADYPNQWVYRAIDAPRRIVMDHLSAPHFVLDISLVDLPGGGCRVVWRARFDSAEMRRRIATFAVQANQENFDRLGDELQRCGAS